MFVLNANNQKPLPNVLNQDTFYKSAYPNAKASWYLAAPSWQVKYWTVNTNLTFWISDFTIAETVWSTQINGFFRSLVDVFENMGNFYTNTDYWTQTEMGGWYAGFAYNALIAATRNFSFTQRYASFERLKAGKTVWAEFAFAPAYKFLCNWPSPSSLTYANAQVTAVLKIMDTSWTLTTIWTLTTTAKTWSSTSGSPWYTMDAVKVANFTPVTSADGDRIVIDITFTVDVTIPAGTGWSGWSTGTLLTALGFGYEWSKRQVILDYQAARPFQISIT